MVQFDQSKNFGGIEDKAESKIRAQIIGSLKFLTETVEFV